MSGPHLHHDVLDSIVDLLQDDRIVLRSCSLVSKSWLPRTRRHLFKEIRLSATSYLQSWKDTFPDSSASPARYTKLLSITCPQEIVATDTEEGGWLHAFSHITKLEIYDHTVVHSIVLQWDIDESLIVSLVPLYGFFPALRSLELSVATFPPSEISSIIYSFPLLENITLALHGYDDVDEQPFAVQPPRSPPFTASLRLEARMGIHLIVSRLFSGPADPCFRELLLHVNKRREFAPAAKLIHSCSSNLESLQVDHYPSCYEPPAGELIDLSNAMKLNEVIFGCHSNPEWISSSLQTITQDHRDLQSVTIRILYPFYNLDREVFDRVEFMHPAVARKFRAWLDLDRVLIRLQESLPIRLKLMYKAPGRREARFVSRLLPEAAMRVGVEFSMDI